MITNLSDRKLLLCATAFTALSLTACAEPAAQDADAEHADDAPGQPETLAQEAPVTVPNPAGTYFADVFANGSGCPQGSWDVSISPDGQVFTATFSKYEVDITANTLEPLVQSDCTLSVKLHSPQGQSYAITSFSYSGYAFLEQGVTARLSARYWFQGNPIPPATSNRTDLVGPLDRSFLFNDDVETRDRVYSACGTTRDLNVHTRLQLLNGSPKAGGYANVASIDGRTELKFGLAWRPCGAGGAQSGGNPSGGTASTPSSPVNPPVSQPPVSQPPVSQPPVSQPPVSQPPVSQPPRGNPPSSGSTGTRPTQPGGVTRGGTIGGVTRSGG